MTIQELTITFLPFLVACITTLIATPITLIFLKKFQIIDDPKKHIHPAIIHKTPVPRGGGIPFLLGILAAGFIFLPLNPITIALYSASLVALIIGVLDDKLDISPYVRFLVNILVATIVVGTGVTIPFITNPFNGILQLDLLYVSFVFFNHLITISFSQLIAILWIVWVMNMLNWSKGVDGQMPGIVAISALVIGILSMRFSQTDSQALTATTLSFAIAGSAIGFLVFNFYPAKIFPGYGATAVYLMLSVVSILSGAKLATAILVMGVPMIDGAFTILRRIFSGKSPFWHDNKHLHHLLLRLGVGQRKIALFYWCVSGILGLISLNLNSKGKLFAIVMLVAFTGGGLLFLHYFMKIHEKNAL